jgi:hypothetical protein
VGSLNETSVDRGTPVARADAEDSDNGVIALWYIIVPVSLAAGAGRGSNTRKSRGNWNIIDVAEQQKPSRRVCCATQPILEKKANLCKLVLKTGKNAKQISRQVPSRAISVSSERTYANGQTRGELCRVLMKQAISPGLCEKWSRPFISTGVGTSFWDRG